MFQSYQFITVFQTLKNIGTSSGTVGGSTCKHITSWFSKFVHIFLFGMLSIPAKTLQAQYTFPDLLRVLILVRVLRQYLLKKMVLTLKHHPHFRNINDTVDASWNFWRLFMSTTTIVSWIHTRSQEFCRRETWKVMDMMFFFNSHFLWGYRYSCRMIEISDYFQFLVGNHKKHAPKPSKRDFLEDTE